MSYPAKAVANFFIQKANERGDNNLDLMKLLKLIYVAHGWSLAILHKPLINEPIEAWRYGPVINNIYQSLKHFGMMPIKKIPDVGENDLMRELFCSDFDGQTKALLEQIYKVNREATGIDLSNWSHDPDGPWYKAWHESSFPRLNVIIPDGEIKTYFQSLKERNAA